MGGRENRSFNRRDFPHYDAELLAGFSKFPGLVIDHSMEGIRLLTDYDPFEHSRRGVEVHIDLGPGKVSRLKGRIVRVEKNTGDEAFTMSLGILLTESDGLYRQLFDDEGYL